MDDLILAASRVLEKFTEGREDWTEYTDLCDAINLAACADGVDSYVQRVALRRVDDFRRRAADAQKLYNSFDEVLDN